MKRNHKIVIIVLIQVLFLFGMIGFKQYTLSFGTPVLLKSAPVDPWDIFRGEYARLSFDISRIKCGDLDAESYQRGGTTVFVVLERGEKYRDAVSISLEKPGVRANQVFIKGKLEYYNSENQECRVAYGIETFYVEEGRGSDIERLRNMDVLVRIDRFGNAVIEKLL